METLKFFNKLSYVIFTVVLVGFVCSSCSQVTGKQQPQDEILKEEYEAVYTSAASAEALVVALVGFEAEHPKHFQSKLDLAQLYFAEGEYVLSYQYLQRALTLVEGNDFSPASSKIDAASMELLHRLLGYLCLFRGDLLHAEEYGRMALSYAENVAEGESGDEFCVPGQYLMGQVLYSSAESEDFSQSDRLQEALNYFDRAYSTMPTMIAAPHLLGYGKLLVQANRVQEAESLVEEYLSLGNWNLDTASIAKTIYEAGGNQEKAAICEFLAYEYLVGGISEEAAQSWGSEYEVLSESAGKKWLSEYEALVESCTEAENQMESGDFFGKRFCEIANKMAQGRETKSDLDGLLEIESYFVNFPSYYWLLWQLSTEVLDQEATETFIPALKKCISLNSSGIYAKLARHEIKKLLGNRDFAQSETKDSLLDSILF